MLKKYGTPQEKEQEVKHLSQQLSQELETFLLPFLLMLEKILDKRLIRVCLESMIAIVRFRNEKQGLLLSELGSYMSSSIGRADTATAGTKRLGNFIRSKNWSSQDINKYLEEQADKEVERRINRKERILCVWDGSVLEKEESRKIEGICPVISSKAKRLRKSRKGIVFNQAGGKPIMVAGMHWLSGLITGMDGSISVAFMDWWTTKGKYATKQREQERELLTKAIGKWGYMVIHVFDRGYASGGWLAFLQECEAFFVIRWIKTHFFLTTDGQEKKLWQIGQGKKYLEHKVITDQNGQKINCSVWWTKVRHANYAEQLFYVKVRVGKKIWRLITNEQIEMAEQAWTIFFTYRRRWKIEMSFRYGKSELGMESPRLWSWEHRRKILGLVTLVYAFLLSLLKNLDSDTLTLLFQLKCHRTGKRCQDTLAPLYRLRWALSRLWDHAHPILGCFFPPNLDTLRVFAAFGSLNGFPKNQG